MFTSSLFIVIMLSTDDVYNCKQEKLKGTPDRFFENIFLLDFCFVESIKKSVSNAKWSKELRVIIYNCLIKRKSRIVISSKKEKF